MKRKIMLISSLIGLSLIVNEVKASGTTLNMVNNTTSVVSVEETLSEKFQSLYKSNTNASQLNLTANVLEAYQNNKIEFLALTKEEKLTFNQTIKNLSTQAQNIQDEKSLNWIKEINKSAKNINIIWSINEKSPAIDVDLKDMTEAPSSLIVVFKQ
ncbi:MAG: hypothetical protein RI995_1974 [Bacteroidota bacterium]|jgi:hypothetical protein